MINKDVGSKKKRKERKNMQTKHNKNDNVYNQKLNDKISERFGERRKKPTKTDFHRMKMSARKKWGRRIQNEYYYIMMA